VRKNQFGSFKYNNNNGLRPHGSVGFLLAMHINTDLSVDNMNLVEMDELEIGLIGLGAMGMMYAKRLVEAGWKK